MSVKILHGDALTVLKTLPDESVNCCVSSPPYWGLRDYGVDGQLGLERTPEIYVEKMVEVFREVRRVLRDDGVAWINLGDSYCSHDPGGRRDGEFLNPNGVQYDKGRKTGPATRNRAGVYARHAGLKPKDLVGIPWMTAFALRADGWYLRQDIIWHKPNPMPESVTDRCTKAHEYIFLMSKSQRYHFDAEAIKENGNPANYRSSNCGRRAVKDCKMSTNRAEVFCDTRNKRSVWTVPTAPFPGAHFATFPPKLIEPCILAGCPAGGTVIDPFGGSGTVGMVAEQHGRNSILIELNPKYIEMAKRRTAQQNIFAGLSN